MILLLMKIPHFFEGQYKKKHLCGGVDEKK